MNRTPSHSALTIAAAAMRGIWAVMFSRHGLFGAERNFELLIAEWVNGILGRLEAMLVRFRAGTLKFPEKSNAGTVAREAPQARPAARMRVAGAAWGDGAAAGAADELALVGVDALEMACGEMGRVANAVMRRRDSAPLRRECELMTRFVFQNGFEGARFCTR